MNRFAVDFAKAVGPVKRMHSVNNGPSGGRGMDNSPYFTQAGIPFARLHDSAFYAGYGGSHSVDVIALFPDLNADVNDPASYDFALTDEYLQKITATGTKVFYRLGNKIEHESKKYGTQVPPDFQKWAEICEHIIRHYNEGWADGLHLGIEYWEIWNEPDCGNPDGSNPCWQGTQEQFCELFRVTLKHLKACFPHLKIGGPAFCFVNVRYTEKLLAAITRDGEHLPLDFYSYHGYCSQPEKIAGSPAVARELLDKYGYTDTELILNEWNYVRHWVPAEEIKYSYKTIKSLKGAAFVGSVMSVMQDTPLDQLMYYDARPSAWNGLFDPLTLEPLKPYFAFQMFNELYKVGQEAKAEREGEIYGTAACGKGCGAATVIRYLDADEAPLENTRIELKNLPPKAEIRYLLLDDAHDLEEIRRDVVCGGEFVTEIPMKLFDSILILVNEK